MYYVTSLLIGDYLKNSLFQDLFKISINTCNCLCISKSSISLISFQGSSSISRISKKSMLTEAYSFSIKFNVCVAGYQILIDMLQVFFINQSHLITGNIKKTWNQNKNNSGCLLVTTGI